MATILQTFDLTQGPELATTMLQTAVICKNVIRAIKSAKQETSVQVPSYILH
jgi:hypothetical protein